MQQTPFIDNLIYEHQSIKDALEKLNKSPKSLTLFVLNIDNQMVGTLTDGDIRRGLLNNKTIANRVRDFMFQQFRFLQEGQFNYKDVDNFKSLGIRLVPMLDKHYRILNIIDLNEKRAILPIDAVIMAGGRGSRLRPLTDNTPKPLLKVGGKPIIEYNIDRLNKYGISNVCLTVKYLAQQLVDYFGNGSSKSMNITYIHEQQFLGTIGAVGLKHDFVNNTILVMNSDLLTNIDFANFYQHFIDSKAQMMLASIPYDVKIPYAVLETKKDAVVSFKEKPTYTYYSNAGIYLIKKEALQLIPKNKFYNATDLMEALIANNQKVGYYPIVGYWLDIGKPADFTKAQEDVQHIQF